MYGTNAAAAGPALAITGMASLGWGVALGMTLIATGIALSVFAPRLGRRRHKPRHVRT